MLRRIAMPFALVGALLVIGAAPVAADTEIGPTPVNVYFAGTSFTFTEGGVDYFGIGQIEEERISNKQYVSFFFSGSGSSAICDGGTPTDPTDDYEGRQYIDFSATSSTVTSFDVKKDLSKAELRIVAKGKRQIFDACTGELVSAKSETHQFAFQIKATAPGVPETNVNIVTTGDGTFQVTDTYVFRPAAGPATLDNRPVVTSDAMIQHVTVSVLPL